jgi:serine O-acetyltransferase
MKMVNRDYTVEKLQESYQKDSEPFILDSNIKFREKVCDFKELKILRELFFPNYWNCGIISKDNDKLQGKISEFANLLITGIKPYLHDEKNVLEIIKKVLEQLPFIREVLKTDIIAAFKGDPAAKDYTEIIRSYPGFSAIMVQRVAHILYSLNIKSYARELTEEVHSLTGIDIHPGASIGEYFFIDHGTGVVIGETCEIGNHVRLYQQVTLGALHFKKDDQGALQKDYKRHPTLKDRVVIGAGAKILGPVIIGHGVSIGANSWVQEDIPDNTIAFISEHPKLVKKTKNF